MKIEVKRLSQHDVNEFVELINVFEAAFEMKNQSRPDKSYLHNILTRPGFWVIVAKHNNKVVGGLTVYILDQYYSVKPSAYLYDLAVLKAFQRKGIGKMLINYLIDYCRENNFEEMFVQADRIDDEALAFYRSTNATKEEDVIHFSYSLEKGK